MKTFILIVKLLVVLFLGLLAFGIIPFMLYWVALGGA